MPDLNRIITQIEVHDVEGIKDSFAAGIDPNTIFRGAPLIYELTSEYTRSPRFKACVQAFVDHGLNMPDKALLAVLLNDAAMLEQLITADQFLITKKYTLRCAYTPLYQAGLMHICAEFDHVDCAKILLKHGAAINFPAGVDANGFGGQTPIFHTVNQNRNQSGGMFAWLLENGADCTTTITGLIWGKGYDWETFIPAVNAISYAMMGLLPQMHRDPEEINAVISRLIKYAFEIDYIPVNVPNKYLNS